MTTHVELYRALEPHVGPQAAQMIADAVPPAADIATKEGIANVIAEIRSLEAKIFRWGLAMFAPVWGAMIAIVIRG